MLISNSVVPIESHSVEHCRQYIVHTSDIMAQYKTLGSIPMIFVVWSHFYFVKCNRLSANNSITREKKERRKKKTTPLDQLCCQCSACMPTNAHGFYFLHSHRNEMVLRASCNFIVHYWQNFHRAVFSIYLLSQTNKIV